MFNQPVDRTALILQFAALTLGSGVMILGGLCLMGFFMELLITLGVRIRKKFP